MPKLVIGLDLSGESWKSIVISSGLKEKLRVEGYASFPPLPFAGREFFSREHAEESVETAMEEWAVQVHEALSPFLAQARGVVIGTPQDAVSLRVLELPFLQAPKIRSVLPYEVESSLPFDAEDLLFDFYPLRQEQGKTRLLSAAVSRNLVGAALEHLKMLMLDPVILAPTSLSLHHLIGLSTLPAEAADERLLFLDIGACFSQLCVVEGGRTVFSTCLRGGKDELAALCADGQAAGAAPLMSALRRTFHYLEGYPPLVSGCPPPMRRLVLLGEGAAIDGSDRALAEALGLETTRFRFPDESMLEETRIPAELQPALAPALALALEYAAPNGKPVLNFRRNEFVYKPEQRLLIRKAIFPGVLALIMLLGLAFNYYVSGASEKDKAADIRNEIGNAFRAAFPGQPVSDPAAQLKATLKSYKEKQKSYEELDYPSALSVLAEISKAISPDLKVTVTSFDCKGKDVSISGTASKLDETNEVEKRLAAVPGFIKVKLDRATSAKDKTEDSWHFSIKIELKKVHGK
jgi:general secretion pathway protein L